MVIDIFLVVAGAFGLILASVTDIKTREVPDLLNYSLVAIGLGLRLIHSLASGEWAYFLSGMIGFIIFFALALAMFYAGQWGGGDSKLLFGLGALFGSYPVFLFDYFNPYFRVHFLFAFTINLLIVGAIFGLVWSTVLSIKRRKKFKKEYKRLANEKKYKMLQRVVIIVTVVLIVSMVLSPNWYIRLMFFSLIFVAAAMFYLYFFAKAVERACMYKRIDPCKLTEGDWIVKDIKIDGKYICGPRDLGVSNKAIKRLIAAKKRGKIKKILIKEGVPFVPSFLVAFVITIIWGNVLLLILG